MLPSHLSRTKLLPGIPFVYLFEFFFLFSIPAAPRPLPRCSRSSSRFHGSSSPRRRSALNASNFHGSPAFHVPCPSSRHFAHSGEPSPQQVPSGSHGSTSCSRDSLGLSTEPPLSFCFRSRKSLNAYGLNLTLRVCLVILGQSCGP